MVAEAPQKKAVVCPLCAKAVTYFPEQESADAAVERHTARECDPANYNRVHNKRRCPVPGCKERITATNVYRCRDCGVEVCMKHRYNATDHACGGKPGWNNLLPFTIHPCVQCMSRLPVARGIDVSVVLNPTCE